MEPLYPSMNNSSNAREYPSRGYDLRQGDNREHRSNGVSGRNINDNNKRWRDERRDRSTNDYDYYRRPRDSGYDYEYDYEYAGMPPARRENQRDSTINRYDGSNEDLQRDSRAREDYNWKYKECWEEYPGEFSSSRRDSDGGDWRRHRRNSPENSYYSARGYPTLDRRGGGGRGSDAMQENNSLCSSEDYYTDDRRGFQSRRECGMEEFDKNLRPKNVVSPSAPHAAKKKIEWPPPFEQDGSSFVFDSRCGMFYESESDFFYDPKSKLYYGNKQATYYQLNAESGLFDAVTAAQPSSSTTPLASSALDLDPVLGSDSGAKKAAIAIKIKTKSLKKSSADKPKENNLTAPSLNSSRAESPSGVVQDKAKLADMEKWSARSAEMKLSTSQTTSTESATSIENVDANISRKTSSAGKPINVKDNLVCWLCRRKFPSVEKLKHHEQVSQLHKDNLAKQNQQEKESKTKTDEYIDRAQQRRDLYGPDLVAHEVNNDESVEMMKQPAQVVVLASTLPLPQDQLGSSNVGHQMLSKLGWKGGALLGNRSEAQQQLQADLHMKLHREWSRSEQQHVHRQAGNKKSKSGS